MIDINRKNILADKVSRLKTNISEIHTHTAFSFDEISKGDLKKFIKLVSDWDKEVKVAQKEIADIEHQESLVRQAERKVQIQDRTVDLMKKYKVL